MSVVEFLDAVEEPLKDQHIPEAKGKTIYASLLGTAANLTPVENVNVNSILVPWQPHNDKRDLDKKLGSMQKKA